MNVDFCEKEFKEGLGKCTNEECKDRHDIDFSKRGICIYEYQKEGSCKRGRNCWFLHDVPTWFKNSDEGANAMREKSQRMKSRTRVVTNRNSTPPIWQDDVVRNNQHGVIGPPHIPPVLKPFTSPIRMQQRSNYINSDFLEMINKAVEESLKRHTGLV